MKSDKSMFKLYFIMGSLNCKDKPETILKAAIKGGITIFQYREKGLGCLEGTEKFELAKRLHTICREAGIPFIVNDDVELAIELGADGVHIGQDDGNIQAIRKRIGGMLLGVSAHNTSEALHAAACGADYLGVGPMYHTTTKKDIEEVKGPSVIREIRQAGLEMPIVGIGGITTMNKTSVTEAGADGIAIISAISMSENPRLAAEMLLK